MGVGIGDLGDDQEAYRGPYLVKNNWWRDDYRGLVGFCQVFGSTGDEFEAHLEEVIDVDEWLCAFAFATLSGAVDNYATGAAHNANFYVRPADGRVLYFLYDLDLYSGSPEGPLVGTDDLAKLVATPARARTYYGHLYDIVTTAYNGE
ncbi:MAG: CotH kinase family protein [Polyangiaceae bacterium]|nr:CotH kinase family protein [Polyangiaceae bacterium]